MTVLPDVLRPGLRLVFCGSAASPVSAAKGAYYAGPGNRFWETVYAVGLTPHQVAPQDFRTLLDYDIGLTDLAQTVSGTDDQVKRSDYDVPTFLAKVTQFMPKIIAFTGKRPAQMVLGKPLDYGLQLVSIAKSHIFVLPSPSGAARRYWDITYWQQLAHLVQSGSVTA